MSAQETELIQQLYRGPRPARELCDALGISQATFSRLLAKMKTRIKPLGKGKSTVYVGLREVRAIGRRIPIFLVSSEGKCKTLGDLSAFYPQGYALTKSGIQTGAPEIYKGI